MARMIAGPGSGHGAAALAELYERYADRAYRVARSVCRDHGCAEDAVQETFASVFKSRMTYRSQRGTVAAWVLSVALHRAIDLSRTNIKHASRRVQDDALVTQPAPGDVAEQAVARTEAVRVRESLAGLPGAQREVITLAFYGDMTHGEIATRLGLPVGTVKGRMRLGMDKLRRDVASPVVRGRRRIDGMLEAHTRADHPAAGARDDLVGHLSTHT